MHRHQIRLLVFDPLTGGYYGMGRLENYRARKSYWRAMHSAIWRGNRKQTLYDTERDHYQVLLVGWEELPGLRVCVACGYL